MIDANRQSVLHLWETDPNAADMRDKKMKDLFLENQ